MGKNDEQLPMVLRAIIILGDKFGVPALMCAACIWFLDRRATEQDKVMQGALREVVSALHDLSNRDQVDHEKLREAIEKVTSGTRSY